MCGARALHKPHVKPNLQKPASMPGCTPASPCSPQGPEKRQRPDRDSGSGPFSAGGRSAPRTRCTGGSGTQAPPQRANPSPAHTCDRSGVQVPNQDCNVTVLLLLAWRAADRLAPKTLSRWGAFTLHIHLKTPNTPAFPGAWVEERRWAGPARGAAHLLARHRGSVPSSTCARGRTRVFPSGDKPLKPFWR